jgi:hypothetical protein
VKALIPRDVISSSYGDFPEYIACVILRKKVVFCKTTTFANEDRNYENLPLCVDLGHTVLPW